MEHAELLVVDGEAGHELDSHWATLLTADSVGEGDDHWSAGLPLAVGGADWLVVKHDAVAVFADGHHEPPGAITGRFRRRIQAHRRLLGLPAGAFGQAG